MIFLKKEKKKQHSNLMEKAIRKEMVFSAISMAIQIPKSEGSLLYVHLNNWISSLLFIFGLLLNQFYEMKRTQFTRNTNCKKKKASNM